MPLRIYLLVNVLSSYIPLGQAYELSTHFIYATVISDAPMEGREAGENSILHSMACLISGPSGRGPPRPSIVYMAMTKQVNT
jgi:hypothetical protein